MKKNITVLKNIIYKAITKDIWWKIFMFLIDVDDYTSIQHYCIEYHNQYLYKLFLLTGNVLQLKCDICEIKAGFVYLSDDYFDLYFRCIPHKILKDYNNEEKKKIIYHQIDNSLF